MMKKTFLVSLVSLSIFLVMGGILVFAQQGSGSNSGDGSGSNPTTGTGPIKLLNPFSGGDSLFTLLESIIDNIILPIGGVLAVLAFIYSGFLYVTAQGNEKKIGDAHRALLYTAVGTAVLLGSWVLAKVIENTINQLR